MSTHIWSTPATDYAHDLFSQAVWRHLTAEEVNHWTKAVETPQGLAWFAEAVAMHLPDNTWRSGHSETLRHVDVMPRPWDRSPIFHPT